MTKREIENLFKTHYTRMYRLAASILYDEDESKDVVSEVFARLMDSDVTLRPALRCALTLPKPIF